MLKKLKLSASDWIVSRKKRLSKGESPGKVTMCKKCYTFYYKNSWHLERPAYIEENIDAEIPVRFTECLLCLEQEIASYGAENEFQYEVESVALLGTQG